MKKVALLAVLLWAGEAWALPSCGTGLEAEKAASGVVFKEGDPCGSSSVALPSFNIGDNALRGSLKTPTLAPFQMKEAPQTQLVSRSESNWDGKVVWGIRLTGAAMLLGAVIVGGIIGSGILPGVAIAVGLVGFLLIWGTIGL